jgi:hypothetical protein
MDKYKLAMQIVNIHIIYMGTESKRPDGKPIPAVHNFKTDLNIHRESGCRSS